MGGLGGCGDVWTCVCERGSVLEGPRKEVLGKGTREGMCSISDAGGNVQGKEMLGKGQRKEHARLLTGGNVCLEKVFANVSAGADTKANTLGAAAHLSSLSTPFSLMQLAMTMADATPSPFLERSIFSVGFVPLSLSI